MNGWKLERSVLLLALGLVGAAVVHMIVQSFHSGPRGAKQVGPSEDAPGTTTSASDEAASEIAQTASPATREQRIKERAFQIWVDEGRPEGRHGEHWRMAEAQIAD
jgi:hypothetical protein